MLTIEKLVFTHNQEDIKKCKDFILAHNTLTQGKRSKMVFLKEFYF